MKLFGLHFGYEEPFWYFQRWEFGLFDQGWVICKGRVQKWAGCWPTYRTIHRSTRH